MDAALEGEGGPDEAAEEGAHHAAPTLDDSREQIPEYAAINDVLKRRHSIEDQADSISEAVDKLVERFERSALNTRELQEPIVVRAAGLDAGCRIWRSDLEVDLSKIDDALTSDKTPFHRTQEALTTIQIGISDMVQELSNLESAEPLPVQTISQAEDSHRAAEAALESLVGLRSPLCDMWSMKTEQGHFSELQDKIRKIRERKNVSTSDKEGSNGEAGKAELTTDGAMPAAMATSQVSAPLNKKLSDMRAQSTESASQNGASAWSATTMPGVLLQAFYKLPPNKALPSPADGTPGVPWWWDHLSAQAHALAQAGFTAVWLPPVLKTSTGAGSGSDGYGPFDDYDIGSKKQKGSVPTRYGTREDLLRCAATLRANGLDIYLDMVEHQRVGDGGQPPEAFNFRYLGANGTPGLGRFPKSPSNFLPQVPRDPNLGGPPADDLPFGRELAPINAKPSRYVFNNLIAGADWLTRTIGAQGYRVDDVKGLSTDFLLPMLNSKAMAGKFAVGEFFDGNAQLVNQWISNPQGMQSRVSAFDFPLKFMLTSMCNNPGRFNMADLDHAGLTGINPLHSVTFVENHDTDLESTENCYQ
jgi:hypothetical protein